METGSESKPTVLVTGFGVFAHYEKNASWEAVKLLEMDDVNLVKYEIPVAYDFVDENIPQLWQKHKPELVIHCGVSHLAKCLTLEQRAFPVAYFKPDVNGQLPKCENTIEESACDYLETGLDVKKICEEVNRCFEKGMIKVKAEASSNAGRYLCEYIYQTSLKEDHTKTLFIHVPTLSEYTASEICAAIKCTIKAALDASNKKCACV